jgi:hypothetical protein
MRLKNYLQELYAAYLSKNTWGHSVPEHKRAIYKNPTHQEMRQFARDLGDNDLRFAACHLNKTVTVWAPDAEIHEYMIDFLKKKGVFPVRSITPEGRSSAFESDYVAGFAWIHSDGSMEITEPMEAYKWSHYNLSLDWKFLSKYFVNWKIIFEDGKGDYDRESKTTKVLNIEG